MNFKKIEVFKCLKTGELFPTKEEADEYTKKEERKIARENFEKSLKEQVELEKLVKADYIRLNLENISDLTEMIIEKSYEFYGISIQELKLNLSFSMNISNSHNAPLNEKTNWDKNDHIKFPGWRGRIEGIFEIPNKYIGLSSFNSAASVMFDKKNSLFRGLYAGNGAGGSLMYKPSKMSMEFYFFLQDFPKLQKKYNLWETYKKIDSDNQKIKNDYSDQMHSFINTMSSEEIKQLNAIASLSNLKPSQVIKFLNAYDINNERYNILWGWMHDPNYKISFKSFKMFIKNIKIIGMNNWVKANGDKLFLENKIYIEDYLDNYNG